jgi:SAM-dependent methyltransferase
MTNANPEQDEHWNSSATVEDWVVGQAAHDAMLAPFTQMILDAATLTSGEHVLDVGCGCGAPTLAAARAVAPGAAHGVDLSAPMLDRARRDAARAGLANVEFEQADVQVHPFAPASFDAVISRFGIMFFADPVAAFANLRRAVRSDGRVAFACWQAIVANPWFGIPRSAAIEHVPSPPAVPAGAPGPFAFADPERPRQVLHDAGWHDIDIASRETSLLLGGPGPLDHTMEFLRTGSMGRTLLTGVDTRTATRALDAVREALAPFTEAEGVRLGAAVWLVTARA